MLWAQYDSAITKQLAAAGSSGVPPSVVDAQGKSANADVLPELLPKTVVLKAIKKDSEGP